MATTKKKNNNNEVTMEKHFCMNCGKQFESASKLTRYCPECAEQKKAEAKAKQKQYAKDRQKRLDLTNASIYKADKEKLIALAKGKETLAETVKRILSGINDI